MAQIELNNPIEGVVDVLRFAGAPTNGAVGTGTFAGKAAKGCLLVDVTNALLYINTGTQASVTWTKVGTQT